MIIVAPMGLILKFYCDAASLPVQVSALFARSGAQSGCSPGFIHTYKCSTCAYISERMQFKDNVHPGPLTPPEKDKSVLYFRHLGQKKS